MRTIASISPLVRPRSQLTLEVFLGKRVVLEPSLPFFPWSPVFSFHFTLSLHFIHGLQSAFYADRFFNADTFLVRREL